MISNFEPRLVKLDYWVGSRNWIPKLIQQCASFKDHEAKMPLVEDLYCQQVRNELKSMKKSAGFRPLTSPQIPNIRSGFTPQSNQHKFALLTQIVNHMRDRHQQAFTHPLTLDESRLTDSVTSAVECMQGRSQKFPKRGAKKLF